MLWSKCSSEHPSFRATLEWPVTLIPRSWIQALFSSERTLVKLQSSPHLGLLWKNMRGTPNSISFRVAQKEGGLWRTFPSKHPSECPKKGAALKEKVPLRRFLTHNWNETETEKQGEEIHGCSSADFLDNSSPQKINLQSEWTEVQLDVSDWEERKGSRCLVRGLRFIFPSFCDGVPITQFYQTKTRCQ